MKCPGCKTSVLLISEVTRACHCSKCGLIVIHDHRIANLARAGKISGFSVHVDRNVIAPVTVPKQPHGKLVVAFAILWTLIIVGAIVTLAAILTTEKASEHCVQHKLGGTFNLGGCKPVDSNSAERQDQDR